MMIKFIRNTVVFGIILFISGCNIYGEKIDITKLAISDQIIEEMINSDATSVLRINNPAEILSLFEGNEQISQLLLSQLSNKKITLDDIKNVVDFDKPIIDASFNNERFIVIAHAKDIKKINDMANALSLTSPNISYDVANKNISIKLENSYIYGKLKNNLLVFSNYEVKNNIFKRSIIKYSAFKKNINELPDDFDGYLYINFDKFKFDKKSTEGKSRNEELQELGFENSIFHWMIEEGNIDVNAILNIDNKKIEKKMGYKPGSQNFVPNLFEKVNESGSILTIEDFNLGSSLGYIENNVTEDNQDNFDELNKSLKEKIGLNFSEIKLALGGEFLFNFGYRASDVLPIINIAIGNENEEVGKIYSVLNNQLLAFVEAAKVNMQQVSKNEIISLEKIQFENSEINKLTINIKNIPKEIEKNMPQQDWIKNIKNDYNIYFGVFNNKFVFSTQNDFENEWNKNKNTNPNIYEKISELGDKVDQLIIFSPTNIINYVKKITSAQKELGAFLESGQIKSVMNILEKIKNVNVLTSTNEDNIRTNINIQLNK